MKDAKKELQNQEEEKELTPEQQKAARKAKIIKEVREWVVALLAALVLVVLIRTFLFTIIRVDGDSMYGTLYDGESMFVTVLDKKLYGVERDDVVICHYPNRGSTYFVKRIWGVPGDLVERIDGVTFINGEAIDPDREGYGYDDYSYTLAEGEYFCVGDNIYNSHDSRAWNDDSYAENYVVGPIGEDMIIGKVRYVIWPLTDAREVQ